jgi:hypothetical protein
MYVGIPVPQEPQATNSIDPSVSFHHFGRLLSSNSILFGGDMPYLPSAIHFVPQTP